MPPDKKFKHSLKVSLSEFEYLALKWMAEATNEPMADQIREAIFMRIVQMSPQSKEVLRRAVDAHAASLLDADERRLFDNQAAQFLPSSQPRRRSTRDPEPSTGIERVGPHESSADDFPEEP